MQRDDGRDAENPVGGSTQWFGIPGKLVIQKSWSGVEWGGEEPGAFPWKTPQERTEQGKRREKRGPGGPGSAHVARGANFISSQPSS